MTVNYAEAEEEEKKATIDALKTCAPRLTVANSVRMAAFYQELKLKPEEACTDWTPPGSPDLMNDPTTKLANLVPIYDRIVVPIHFYDSKSDFQYHYGMSLDTLIEYLKSDPNKYIPILTMSSIWYKKPGFYDQFFETCRSLYGRYPSFAPYRILLLQTALALVSKASHMSVPWNDTQSWLSEAKRKYPEYDPESIRDREIVALPGSLEGVQSVSEKRRLNPDSVRTTAATFIQELRIHGHETLINFLLNDFYPQNRNFSLLYEILSCYTTYLLGLGTLGGYSNYGTSDLENMAFLRILPLRKQDLKQMDRANMRLLLNSPAAHSVINFESCRAKVFLKGGEDVNTLHVLSEFAERHRKERRALTEYREHISSGRLNDASKAFAKSEEVYLQISEEINALAKKTRTVKTANYLISAGATFSDIALLLSNGLPIEWKVILAGLKDVVSFVGLKELDPKRIINWIYSARSSSWYERGIPYLYWRYNENS